MPSSCLNGIFFNEVLEILMSSCLNEGQNISMMLSIFLLLYNEMISKVESVKKTACEKKVVITLFCPQL